MLHFDYKNTEVLVTGGAGFIGSQLVKALVKAGAHVTVLDDLSTGSLDNLDSVLNAITFVKGSIVDYSSCLKATTSKKIVFHMAAIASVTICAEQPNLCHATNIEGTRTLLQASTINGVQKFIFSSSSAVYGNTEKICTEISLTSPTSEYGYSKLMGEIDCIEYQQKFNIETVILRYFNVFGNNQDGSHEHAGVIAKFKYKMAHHLPITFYGDGLQTRDFVAVEKVVEANMLFGTQAKSSKNIINIASGKSLSLLDLFYELKKQYPEYAVEPQFLSARPDDIMHSRADTTLYDTIYASSIIIPTGKQCTLNC